MSFARIVKILTLSVCLVLPTLVSAAELWSEVLAPARGAKWQEMVYLPPDTSTWTQCGATLTPPSSSAAIQAVVDACGGATDAGGRYIQLSATTPGNPFTFNTGVRIRKGNLVIRGAGANQTEVTMNTETNCWFGPAVFCFVNGNSGAGNFYYYGGGGPLQVPGCTGNCANGLRATISAGAFQGSTSITISSINGIIVGDGIFIQQNNENNEGIYAPWMDCQTKYNVGSATGQNACLGDPAHHVVQVNEVLAISPVGCSTNCTLTLKYPLYFSRWSQSLSPEVWSYAVTNGNPGRFSHNVGVEDLKITPGWRSLDQGLPNGYGTIQFGRVHGGWTKGVTVNGCDTGCVFSIESTGITHMDSYYFNSRGAATSSVSTKYGVAAFTTTGLSVLNNIFHAIQAPIMYGSHINGSVVAFNMSRNNIAACVIASCPQPTPSYPWNWAGMWTGHGLGTNNVLHEGNDMNRYIVEHDHGSPCCFTYFRNLMRGLEKNNGFEVARFGQVLELQTISGRFSNALGNVLGTPGFHNNYESSTGLHGAFGASACNPLDGCSQAGESSIYHLGSHGNEGGSNFGQGNTFDPTVETSFYRWGNYDTVTANVRWCGTNLNTGWSARCAKNPGVGTPTTEVPTGQFVPALEQVPPSFAFASKPPFFNSGVGASVPWPPIGPDVTGGPLGYGGRAYKIPARLCADLIGMNADGTGSILSFNRTTCYGTGGSTPPPDTTPPATPLNFQVN